MNNTVDDALAAQVREVSGILAPHLRTILSLAAGPAAFFGIRYPIHRPRWCRRKRASKKRPRTPWKQRAKRR